MIQFYVRHDDKSKRISIKKHEKALN